MALDLLQETLDLLGELELAGIPYALAGGVALAIHGVPRATIDIDLLVPPDSIEPALEIAHRRGYTVAAMPMRFADGMELRRVTKLSGDQALTLDLLAVNDNLEPVWRSRIRVAITRGEVSVISRAGLIQMKIAAGRPQDLADVRRLQEDDR